MPRRSQPAVAWALVAAGAVSVFAVYYRTLSPGIAGGDSGELVAEGCHLGTAHPPGYPLFTLLVHGLVRLAGHTSGVAYLVNMSSAVFTSVSALLVGLVVAGSAAAPTEIATAATAAAVFSMGSFALSPLIWQYAVTAEVFPMNTFFASLIVYLVVSYAREPAFKVIATGALVCGLALCNQHTIVLFEAPFIVWMLLLFVSKELTFAGSQPRALAIVGKFAALAACFVVGLLPYLYLPIAATFSPKLGSWGDVTTLRGFLHHFLRRDYGTFRLFSGEAGKSAEGFEERTAAYVRDIAFHQGPCPYVIPVLAIVGVVAWSIESANRIERQPQQQPSAIAVTTNNSNNSRIKKKGLSKSSLPEATITADRPNAQKPTSSTSEHWLCFDELSRFTPIVLALTLVFYFVVFHSLSNLPLRDKLLYGIHQRFWMQPNVLVFLFAGFGFRATAQLLDIVVSRLTAVVVVAADGKNGHNRWVGILSLAAAIGLVVTQCCRHIQAADQSDAVYFGNYAAAILSSVPEQSVMLINYDMQWTSVRYAQVCEGLRSGNDSDLPVINLSMMSYNWFESKRHLSPTVVFPGRFLSALPGRSTIDGSFTLSQFAQANLSRGRRLFISGKLSHPDAAFSSSFQLVPHGIASEIIPTSESVPAVNYARDVQQLWLNIIQTLPRLPDVQKYPEETWEWTIGRDIKNRIEETAAFLLEQAIKETALHPQLLLHAIYWLETALALDDQPLPALYKNAGLGHIHLIQSRYYSSYARTLPIQSKDFELFHPWNASVAWPLNDWKNWSSKRVLALWGKFLSLPEAQLDPQIRTIEAIYQKIANLS